MKSITMLSQRLATLPVVIAIILTSLGCSRPSDDVIKAGIQKNVNHQAVRINPMAQSAEIVSHNVTTSYSHGEGRIYEFEASVKIKALNFSGATEERTLPLKGKHYFQKSGGTWLDEPR